MPRSAKIGLNTVAQLALPTIDKPILPTVLPTVDKFIITTVVVAIVSRNDKKFGRIFRGVVRVRSAVSPIKRRSDGGLFDLVKNRRGSLRGRRRPGAGESSSADGMLTEWTVLDRLCKLRRRSVDRATIDSSGRFRSRSAGCRRGGGDPEGRPGRSSSS